MRAALQSHARELLKPKAGAENVSAFACLLTNKTWNLLTSGHHLIVNKARAELVSRQENLGHLLRMVLSKK